MFQKQEYGEAVNEGCGGGEVSVAGDKVGQLEGRSPIAG